VITHEIRSQSGRPALCFFSTTAALFQTGITSDVLGSQPSVNGASQLAETTTVKAGKHHRLLRSTALGLWLTAPSDSLVDQTTYRLIRYANDLWS
jgi:hypothetical protein